ncbi:hypothetical protein R3P38DRAFT_3042176 [Favolaschia claudopus]|uniref:Uncharacterized protein n=1 Tax=Favolaschia claudopus TaxID=2862362 RepID=A0AAW0A7T5_9AGAR
MTKEADGLLRSLVRVTDILRARNLELDISDLDYGAIRHSSLDVSGQRFLYVDFRRLESTSTASSGRRERWSWYRPWVAGKVVKTEQQMVEYPILDAQSRKLCTVVHLASTNDEHLAPTGYFCKQLEALTNIIRDENILPIVQKITSWVDETNNTIQVVQCDENDYSRLRVGDCVMFLVYLTRDEYLTRTGQFIREYGLWADLMSSLG